MLWSALVTENDCVTLEAALYVVLPPWLAVSVHVPTVTGVMVYPETVHTPVVLLTSETVSPDDAVGDTLNAGRYCRVPGFVNVIVWFCFTAAPLHDNDEPDIEPMPVVNVYVPVPELYAAAPM